MNNQNHYNVIYYDKLVKSFLSAKGLKSSNINLNSEYFISEFTHWVEERKTIGLDYLSFISSLLKLNNNQEIIAGVGKGEVNTLITNINDNPLY
ncbi:unknown [Clostridium sp. CAG:914]|nr:unknown [Clostridium sp. CAG:914]